MPTYTMQFATEAELAGERREHSIARYMEKMGLAYEMESAGNVFGALATRGGSSCVMAQTYHEDTNKMYQYFVGYYPTVMQARDVQQAIINASPRKRFVQSVIVIGGNN